MPEVTAPLHPTSDHYAERGRLGAAGSLVWAVVSLGAVALPMHAHGKDDTLFATTHVLVRVQAGYEARQDADGDWTFARSVEPNDRANQMGAAAGQGAAEVDALSRIMRGFGVSNIVRPLPYTPLHADTAMAVGLDRWWRIDIPEGSNALAVADLLKASWNGFEVSEVDGVGGLADIPNDSSFNVQYALLNTGQSGGTVGADIRAVGAWDIVSGNPDIVIGVLDSGL
ncbi:MAG: hypothetical protein FJ285_07170, partial [Planctomycetes bacterium]|nr:hypothetical protein [Planctomycetota bacterium]